MELCEDLIDRVQLYQIFNYLSGDEQTAVEKLKYNWKVEEDQDKSSEKQVVTAKGHFSTCLAYLFN